MNRTIATCLVDRCDWTLDVTPPSMTNLGIRAEWGPGLRFVDQAYRRHRERIEHQTTAHMHAHSVLELVATISRLHAEVAVLRAQVAAPKPPVDDLDWLRLERHE